MTAAHPEITIEVAQPEITVEEITVPPEITVETAEPQITVVATGPQGPPGGRHVHYQTTASAQWTINHYLGFRPNITVLDSSGRLLFGGLAHTNANTAVLSFTAPYSGTAYLS